MIATTGSERKRQRALEIGADAVLDYRDPGWPEQVRAATPGGRGVSVAFDTVGAETWARSLACLDRAGRMLCSGQSGGATVELDLRAAYRKVIAMHFHMQGALADLRALVDLVADGSLTPVIDRRLPLGAAARAARHLEAQGQFGNVVLVPDALYGPGAEAAFPPTERSAA